MTCGSNSVFEGDSPASEASGPVAIGVLPVLP